MGRTAVAELWRRADIRGRTRHLLHPLSASLRENGHDDWDDMLAEEDIQEDVGAARLMPPESNVDVRPAAASRLTRPAEVIDPLLNSIERKSTLEVHGPKRDRFPVCFHVIEVCGGIGGIGAAAIRRNCRTLNLELKLGWDVLDAAVFRWLIWICLTGRCFFK